MLRFIFFFFYKSQMIVNIWFTTGIWLIRVFGTAQILNYLKLVSKYPSTQLETFAKSTPLDFLSFCLTYPSPHPLRPAVQRCASDMITGESGAVSEPRWASRRAASVSIRTEDIPNRNTAPGAVRRPLVSTSECTRASTS